MANGLYSRMVDPNFAAPTRGASGATAGIGAPGAAGLPRPQDDSFDAQQMAGLLGMIAKQKKPGEEGMAAPGAGAPGAAQPGMSPITNEGNFDMAPAMAQGAGALPNGGNFAMPPAGSGEAFQLGNVGAPNAPLMSNFGGGIPAQAPQMAAPQIAAMPQGIGGAGLPQFGAAAAQEAAANPGFLSWLGGLFSGGGAGA